MVASGDKFFLSHGYQQCAGTEADGTSIKSVTHYGHKTGISASGADRLAESSTSLQYPATRAHPSPRWGTAGDVDAGGARSPVATPVDAMSRRTFDSTACLIQTAVARPATLRAIAETPRSRPAGSGRDRLPAPAGDDFRGSGLVQPPRWREMCCAGIVMAIQMKVDVVVDVSAREHARVKATACTGVDSSPGGRDLVHHCRRT